MKTINEFISENQELNEAKVTTNQFIDAIIKAVDKAPDREKNKLATAIEDFHDSYKGSFSRLRAHPAFGYLLDELIEIVDARPGGPGSGM